MTVSKQSQDGTGFVQQNQFHPDSASGWLFKKKSFTVHSNMNVKCRSIDTDYQSNCVAVTTFISTYLFHHAIFICPKPKSAVYGTERFITTTCSLASPFLSPLTGAYGGPSPCISQTQFGVVSRAHAPSKHRCSQFCGVARSTNHGFVVGIRVT
jgi:hypothetical protein